MHHITQDLKNGTATCSCGAAFGTRDLIRNILAHVPKPQAGYMNIILILFILGLSALLAGVTVWFGELQK